MYVCMYVCMYVPCHTAARTTADRTLTAEIMAHSVFAPFTAVAVQDFEGWSGALNVENVECYCVQRPGSGPGRQVPK